jgi:hypothetical protein
MRLAALAALAVLAARSPAADPPPVALPLTQFEVLGLMQQGLSDEAVIAKLRETKSSFRLTEGDKQMLKALGVSGRVLAAMAGATPKPGQLQRTVVTLPDGQTVERLGVDFNTPPVVSAAPAVPAPPRQAGPVGTWYRHVGPMLFVLKVGPDHLTATMTQTAAVGTGTASMGMTFSADYVPTRDGGTLHGLITGADVVAEGDLPDGDLSGADDMFKKLGAMADQPFALSFRVRDGELFVRNVRVAGPSDPDVRGPFEMLAGRYRSAGDKPVPKPRPVQPQQTYVGGMTLPPPQQLAPLPQLPQPAPMPYPLPAPPPLPPTAAPVLSATYSTVPPIMTVPPAPVPMTIPAAAPVPAPPAPPPAGPKLAGSWVREFDGMQVVLKFTDRRLFATLNVAYAEEGKTGEMRMTFRADADYAVGPDGTLFGVVTGTDFTPPKDESAGMAGALKAMAGLNGLPFCIRFRIDEGVMSVRDLRCGAMDEEASSVAILGRYTRTEKEPPPPKAVKMPKGCDGPQCQPPAIGVTAGFGGMTLPSPHYLKHYPRYFPPDPPFPLQREQNVVEVAPAPRRETAPMPREAIPADLR